MKIIENDNSSDAEEGQSNLTHVLVMPDYVFRTKFVMEGVLLPVFAAFGFLGQVIFILLINWFILYFEAFWIIQKEKDLCTKISLLNEV